MSVMGILFFGYSGEGSSCVGGIGLCRVDGFSYYNYMSRHHDGMANGYWQISLKNPSEL